MIRSSSPISPSDVTSHYDECDALYRAVWGTDLHHGLWERGDETVGQAIARMRETVFERAEIASGDRVCDVGCGYGNAAIELAQERKARVTGISLSSTQIEWACRRVAESGEKSDRLRFVTGDWIGNGFADESFDVVISIECYSHVEEKQVFFEEIARVLGSGGRMAMTAWIVGREPREWERKWILEPMCRAARFPGIVRAGELREALELNGLKCGTFELLGPRVRYTWRRMAFRFLRTAITNPGSLFVSMSSVGVGASLAAAGIRALYGFETGLLDYAVVGARKDAIRSSIFPE